MPRRRKPSHFPNLPHLELNAVKGKVYPSVRVGKGKRIPLPHDPTDPEFMRAYSDALAGIVRERPGHKPKDPDFSFGALIPSWKRSKGYLSTKASTRPGYDRRAEIIRTLHGHRLVPGLTHKRVLLMLEPFADRPGEYRNLLKVLRLLIARAIDLEWLTTDPSVKIRAPKGGEVRSWTEAEIDQFRARWPLGTKQRTAFELHLMTGQRRSDVHRMTWADVHRGKISVVQQKTGEKLTIPLHPDLKAVLAAARHNQMTILFTEWGKPFTVDGYSGFLRDAITAAGLPLDCQPHGLRKAAGRRLAEAGCTAKQIMAVLGHRTLTQAENYTREADQARLAEAAILRLEAHTANRVSQTDSEEFGITPKNAGETST